MAGMVPIAVYVVLPILLIFLAAFALSGVWQVLVALLAVLLLTTGAVFTMPPAERTG